MSENVVSENVVSENVVSQNITITESLAMWSDAKIL